jgi:succinate-semialdehyde dehydrogenase/glutarate-semialdehyde dehydrogenase
MAEAALAVATPNLFQTVNPATGEKGPAYQGCTVDRALSIAADVQRAQIAWRRTGFKERAPLMKNAAKVIRDNSLRYAKLMTDEMGKPITDGLAELEKCASCCEYFAEMSDGKRIREMPFNKFIDFV